VVVHPKEEDTAELVFEVKPSVGTGHEAYVEVPEEEEEVISVPVEPTGYILYLTVEDCTHECTENWQPYYDDCQTNDLKLKYYIDENSCGTNDALPSDDHTYVSCNYCSSSWDTTVGECIDGTQAVTYTYTNDCCERTNLESDCNKPEDKTQSCEMPEENKLIIEKIKAKYNTESDTLDDGDTIKDVKPGDELKLTVYVENLYPRDELDMENVEIKVTIEDIDDGDDLDEDCDDFDIRAGKTKSESFSFDIPFEVEEDDYDVTIEVEGEDEDGKDFSAEATLELELEKEKHDIMIRRADVYPSAASCNDPATLDVNVMNIGSEDEPDARLTIINSQLGLDIEDMFELEEDIDSSLNTYSRKYPIEVPSNAYPGDYSLEIRTYSEYELLDSKFVSLTVEECEKEEEKQETPKKEEPKEEVKKEPKEVTTYTTPIVAPVVVPQKEEKCFAFWCWESEPEVPKQEETCFAFWCW